MQLLALLLFQTIVVLQIKILTGLNSLPEQYIPHNALYSEGVNGNFTYASIPQILTPQTHQQTSQYFLPIYHQPQQYIPQPNINFLHPIHTENTYQPQTEYRSLSHSHSPYQQLFLPRLQQQQYYHEPKRVIVNHYQNVQVPKTIPILIDPSFAQNIYRGPMYMKRRTIQDICAAVAPEEKTIIYVLSPKDDYDFSNVETLPPPPPPKENKPKVFFIKYKTPEEADLVQMHIQSQYDALGGSSQVSPEEVSPSSTAEELLDPTNNSEIEANK